MTASSPSPSAPPVSATLNIRAFRREDAETFRALNEAWITRYFALEAEDHRTLNHPQEHVLAPGGHIFMATLEGQPVGCCALIFESPGVFELAKMAVAEEHRGRGIGRRLLVHVVEQARLLGATRVTLGSNSVLANAVHLYESVGFRHLPPERVHSHYERADVHMELLFEAQG